MKKPPHSAIARADESAAAAGNPSLLPKKKKVKAISLEEQVRLLEEENQALRLQLKVGKESSKQNERGKADIVLKIKSLIHPEEGCAINDQELKSQLKSYMVRYSDCSTDHAAVVENHMTQIERLLSPTKVTRMALWALNQDDDFFKPTLNPNESLFAIMGQTIEASADQMEQFKSYRINARSLVHKLRFTERACEDLKAKLQRKNRAVEEEMHELQDILNSAQLAKLIVWANQNPELSLALKKAWSTEEGEEEETSYQVPSTTATTTRTQTAAASMPFESSGEEEEEDEET